MILKKVICRTKKLIEVSESTWLEQRKTKSERKKCSMRKICESWANLMLIILSVSRRFLHSLPTASKKFSTVLSKKLLARPLRLRQEICRILIWMMKKMKKIRVQVTKMTRRTMMNRTRKMLKRRIKMMMKMMRRKRSRSKRLLIRAEIAHSALKLRSPKVMHPGRKGRTNQPQVKMETGWSHLFKRLHHFCSRKRQRQRGDLVEVGELANELIQ